VIRPGTRRPWRLRALPCAAGLFCLLVAWIFATQAFAGPDEVQHYLRALSIANGTLVGPKVPYPGPVGTAAQRAWVEQNTRAVSVPPGLAPPGVNCVTGLPDSGPRACVEATEVGNYHPLPYLLPALAIRASNTANPALWLSRLASALPCLVFLLLALALLWNGSAWSVAGLLAAITPMVLFVSSVLNPNGLQIAAALAFFAGLLRIARAPEAVSDWVRVATTVAGVVTIAAWQLGPAFALLGLAVTAGLLGRTGVRNLWRSTGPGWRVAFPVCLGLALCAHLVYGFAAGVSHSSFGISPFFPSLRAGFDQLDPVLRDSVGNFGSLTIHLPTAVYWIWWLLVLLLVAAAVWVGSARERVMLGLTCAVALLLPVLFYAWAYRFTGFGMQGRYVLSALALIPLVSGEIAYRHVDRLARAPVAGPLLAAALAMIALLQGYAWWYAARDAAGTRGILSFVSHAAWKPPLGWVPWTVLAGVGCVALLVFAAEPLRGSRPRTALSG
jgi:hypothetical protein